MTFRERSYPIDEALVTDTSRGLLRCNCRSFAFVENALKAVGFKTPMPAFCEHTFRVQREGRDEGWLAIRNDNDDGLALDELYVGWQKPPKVSPYGARHFRGFVYFWATLEAGNNFAVYVDNIAASSLLGYVPYKAGRREIARTIAPHLTLYGALTKCKNCEWTFNYADLNEPAHRYQALMRGAWLLNNDGRCANCTNEDLVPSF